MGMLITQDPEQNASEFGKRYSLLKTPNLHVQERDENVSLWLGLARRWLSDVDVAVAATRGFSTELELGSSSSSVFRHHVTIAIPAL